MRYFRITWEAARESRGDTKDPKCLFDEFDKRALAFPTPSSRVFDEGALEGASLVCLDASLDESGILSFAHEACERWGVSPLGGVEMEECTFAECFTTHGFSRWRDAALQAANLFELHSLFSERELIKDRLAPRPLAKERALELAAKTRHASALTQELERMYAPRSPAQARRPLLPVHYLVEGANPARYEPTMDTLLAALSSAGRLPSSHVFHLNVDKLANRAVIFDHDRVRSLFNEKLLEALDGNTLVVEYGRFDDDGEFDVRARSAFEDLLRLLEPYRGSIQTMFLVPPGKPDLKQRIRNRFAAPLVDICEDVGPSLDDLGFQESLRRLEDRAASEGLSPDERLAVLLERDGNLEKAYGSWEALVRAEESFPQYGAVLDEEMRQGRRSDARSARQELSELVGLEEPKRLIEDVLARFEMNRELVRRGLPAQSFSMHLAFTGAPGTGKTEVARLYARILKEEGVLSEGRLVIVSGSESWDARRTFDGARGSVLFIDEAYGLRSRPDKITEIIALMESRRDDTVVILAGYEREMDCLLDSNPGFRSRLGFAVEFPDYTEGELLEVFQLMCRRGRLVVPEASLAAVRERLAQGGRRDDQGNARFVRKLFEDAVGAQQVRLARRHAKGAQPTCDELRTILPEDVGFSRPLPKGRSARQELDDLIGLDEVKKLVHARLDLARVQKMKRDAGLDAPFVPMHMAFRGNPGTGKTEVARLIGRILKEEGVLSVGGFYECGRQDLVGQFVGSTAPKVADLFQRAKGSVIFIDEAYSLIDGRRGGFGDEAITAIVDQMEKLREDVVVVFAGYPDELDALFATNPGFGSRVKTQIEFPDYGPDELFHILCGMARRQGLVLSSKAKEKARGILRQASKEKGFGNARFARNLLEDAVVAQSARLARRMDAGEGPLGKRALSTLTVDDFSWEPKNADRGVKLGFSA